MTIGNILLGTAIGAICYCLGRWGKEINHVKLNDLIGKGNLLIKQQGKIKRVDDEIEALGSIHVSPVYAGLSEETE